MNNSNKYDHRTFMNLARLHQETIVGEWAGQFGNACIWDERPNHGVWLKDEYALRGLVFYEGFREEIMAMYRSGHTQIGMNLLNNALRSEHIPYNLFFPMMKIRNKNATKGFFNELLGGDAVEEVLDVRIEYAPQPKYCYLNDGTSFDAYMLYRHKDVGLGAVGIEVKYTEKEYSIGETEYKNTHDESGNVRLAEHYDRATCLSGYYLPETECALVEDSLRQIWRNHILGASMVQHGDVSHFSSVTVFPEANPHFHKAAAEYREVLTQEGNATFYTFTYEQMLETMAHHFRTEEHQNWIKYLYTRYLFYTNMPEFPAPIPQQEVENNEGFLNSNIKVVCENQSTAIPVAKTDNRGISQALINAFKQSPVYALYLQHTDELHIGIRNNYLNVYYRLNNIAEVRLANDGVITCAIHPYFLRSEGNSNTTLRGEDIQRQIVDRYDDIKYLVENKKTTTLEKTSQQELVMQNNANPDSKWFCVDVEWARMFNDQEEKDSCMSSRMDIIAISKEAPYRVAVIELKYGKKSINGTAGVIKHIQDFKTLKEGSMHHGVRIDYYNGMCTDICNILEAYNALGISLPVTLKNVKKEMFAPVPEFYIMTMDNNAASSRGTTPKQTMAAYLFSPDSRSYKEWDCRHPARQNVQNLLGINVLDATSALPVTFVFSKQGVGNIHITDILEDNVHEIIRPKIPRSTLQSAQKTPQSTIPEASGNRKLKIVFALIVLLIMLLWLLF